MPRPKTLVSPHKVVAYLGAQTHEMARVIGRGNVSEGIRIALANEYQRIHSEKIDSHVGESGDVLETLGVKRASDLKRK